MVVAGAAINACRRAGMDAASGCQGAYTIGQVNLIEAWSFGRNCEPCRRNWILCNDEERLKLTVGELVVIVNK